MLSPTARRIPSLEEAASFSPQQVVEQRASLNQEIDELKHPVEWFRRQVFGQKSEKRRVEVPGQQLSLGESLSVPQIGTPPDSPPGGRPYAAQPAKGAGRRCRIRPFLRRSPCPSYGHQPAQPGHRRTYAGPVQVIGSKETFRLAQRPGSYVVLKYVRPVVKLLTSRAITCPAAPGGVIEGRRADVSFLAGLLLDKFAYHLPLYRQHQRLRDAGFTVGRPGLTQLAQQGAALLEPIYDALLASIRTSRVIAMDETPIKAGQNGTGKMKQGYFWPIYGEQNEGGLSLLREPPA